MRLPTIALWPPQKELFLGSAQPKSRSRGKRRNLRSERLSTKTECGQQALIREIW